VSLENTNLTKGQIPTVIFSRTEAANKEDIIERVLFSSDFLVRALSL
jgi:hypothetical protein